MLKSLRIKNYALIDDITIEFGKGFNCFLGETGAGKSIIVGALSLLLKGRSDSSVIKKGTDKASIEGVFDIDDINLLNKLNEQDIEVGDELIVKRIISADNKSSIKINGEAVTLNFLSELFSTYADIHSQKDTQLLDNKKYQLTLLDRFSQIDDFFSDYSVKYTEYLKVKKEYEKIINESFSDREIEFFRYDLDELTKANLSLKEESELEDLEKHLKASEKYLTVLNNAEEIYKQDRGLREQFKELLNALNIDDDEINVQKQAIEDLYYDLDEHMNVLQNIRRNIDNSDYDLDTVEDRLYQYSKLKRKHKTDTNGLLAIQKDLEQKISSFDDREHVLALKEKELNEIKKEALEAANKLHDQRSIKAIELENEIARETESLLLKNCRFKVEFKETDLSATGIDDIEFNVAMNKGDDFKPLRNVASGGETSRLMLAIKSVFARISNIDLLILDEIDTGVSGDVALAIGQKIAHIAKHQQVLCISHLAPVIACANEHFLIYKEDNDSISSTYVKELDKDELIVSLAKIANTSTNEKALAAAEELYQNCQLLVNKE